MCIVKKLHMFPKDFCAKINLALRFHCLWTFKVSLQYSKRSVATSFFFSKSSESDLKKKTERCPLLLFKVYKKTMWSAWLTALFSCQPYICRTNCYCVSKIFLSFFKSYSKEFNVHVYIFIMPVSQNLEELIILLIFFHFLIKK